MYIVNKNYPCSKYNVNVQLYMHKVNNPTQPLLLYPWLPIHAYKSSHQARTLPRWWKQWLRRSSATNRSRISTKSLRRSAGEGKKWRRRYRIGNCLIVQEVQQSLGEKWTLRKVSWDVIWASLCPGVLVSWSQPVLILYGQVMARLGPAWITIRSGGG